MRGLILAVVLYFAVTSTEARTSITNTEVDVEAVISDVVSSISLHSVDNSPADLHSIRDKRESNAHDMNVTRECRKDIESKWGNLTVLTKKHTMANSKHAKKLKGQPVTSSRTLEYEMSLPLACFVSCAMVKKNLTDPSGDIDVDRMISFLEKQNKFNYNKLNITAAQFGPIVAKCAKSRYAYTSPMAVKVNYYNYGSKPGYRKEICMSHFQFYICVVNGMFQKVYEPAMKNAKQVDRSYPTKDHRHG